MRKLFDNMTRRSFTKRFSALASGLGLGVRLSNAQCSCTYTGRFYAYGLLNATTDAIGIKATIKTVYNSICCEGGGSTASAYQVAYVNISDSSNGWGQGGWGKERNQGSSSIVTYRYSEVMGNTYHVNYDTSNPPANNSSHTYQVDLNEGTGTWSFRQDGSVYNTFQDNHFIGPISATTPIYSGETYNPTDKMPGTSGNKCSFTGCQYNTGSGYTDAYLTQWNVSVNPIPTTAAAEQVSTTAMNIWCTV